METNLNRTLQRPLKEKERPAEKTKRPSKHWDDHSLTRRNEAKPQKLNQIHKRREQRESTLMRRRRESHRRQTFTTPPRMQTQNHMRTIATRPHKPCARTDKQQTCRLP
ncbi:unnamed protein product [Brassica rapa subsp. narinosa]|uniref:(rape) hypothetical protein n=1 Tax=Brassica napus TaxID=3708 RepID=A0A816XUL0_BRANA|nr:unnamed protein product [Brassica napus]